MTRWRVGALAVVALLVVGAALVPGALRAQVRGQLDARGIDAVVSVGLREVRLEGLVANRGGRSLRCETVRVRPDLIASIASRAPVARSTHADACRVSDWSEPAEAPTDPSPEAPRPAASSADLDRLGQLRIERVEVDTTIGGNRIVGVATEVRRVPEDGAAVAANWEQASPVPWTTDASIEFDAEMRPALLANTPLQWRDATVRFGRAALTGDGVEVAAVEASWRRTVPEGGPTVDLRIGTVTYAEGELRLSEVRGEVTVERAPTELSGATHQGPGSGGDGGGEGEVGDGTPGADATPRDAEAATPPVERQPPPPYLRDALTRISSLPARYDAARVRGAELLARVPLRVHVDDAELSGVPVCGRVRVESAEVDSDGLLATTRCGDWGLEITIPADPSEPVSGRMADFVLDGPHSVSGIVDLEGRVVRDLTGMRLEASMSVEDGGFEHSAVSPLRVSTAGLEVEGSVSIRPGEGGRATVEIEGRASVDGHGRGAVELDARVEALPDGETWQLSGEGGLTQLTECQQMWTALPQGLAPGLVEAGVAFSGSARPRLRGSYRAGAPDSFDLRQDGFMGDCRITELGEPYDVERLADDRFVHTVTEGVTEPLEVGPGTLDYVPLEQLPSFVPASMYVSEEIGFFTNPGVSINLIRRAIRINIREGRYVYGGSTVSQQLVKNLFFTRDKTLSRKLEEAVVVWAMEQTLSKERILELYVNCIEFGPDIWGIRAAALHYFGRGPETLTPMEASFLAALKPAPWIGERIRVRGHSPDDGWWHERLLVLLQRLVDEGPYIDQGEIVHYSPYVVAFPTSPHAGEIGWLPIPRPKGAMFEDLMTARERLGLPLGFDSGRRRP